MSKRPKLTTAQRGLITAFTALIADDGPAAQAFIAQAAEDAAPDELPEIPPKALAALLADFWAFAAARKGTAPVIRLAPIEGAPNLERLEILQDDAPFLVDSIMGEIADQGLSVRSMFHPMVEVARDKKGARQADGSPRRESMIQVILERVGADREAALVEGLRATLADVGAAVDDFPAMLQLMARTLAELEASTTSPTREEDLEFLRWLRDEHFVYLGARVYEYPRLKDGGYAKEEPLFQPEDGLGVLRDPARTVLRRSSEPALLTAQVQASLAGDPVTVAKSNLRSRVHRRGYMDYVGVKRYGADGKPSGEIRFVGLFTAEAYDEPAHAVPLVRAKVANVLARAGKAPGSHNEKRLRNILETYPRDELFQASEDDLLAAALGILHLYDRPRVRLFERRDPFDRFASVLLFVPRDRYDSDLRQRAGEILADAYGGRVSAYYPAFSESPLARVHFIIGFQPGHHAEPSLKSLETQIAAAARTWEDRFAAAVRASGRATPQVADMVARYAEAFTAGYRERYDAEEALADIAVIESLKPGEPVRIRAFRRAADSKTQLRFKLYRPGSPAPLADVLPILEHMGLKAMVETGYPILPAGGRRVYVHEFELDDQHGEHLVFEDVKSAFEDAFTAVWTGTTESDGFNRMVLELSISWREAALIRALSRYRQQSGLDPSQRVQETALSNHPGVARLILDLFRTKFDPAIKTDLATRTAQAVKVMDEIVQALQQVDSLDDDRVLRRLALLVGAIKRTNYYQLDADGQVKPYISFKVASGELADLPLPKPHREIFVWATHIEGVHLRFGPVARGGLRWSDRRDDFRTEVLGLVKAQQTKNAVIVPVGSKGGFYPKQLPKGAAPDVIRAEAIRAYKTFLQGLLDITDNLDPEGKVIHPAGVIAHDGDDPYLVVAADKGTATFSDIANGVAESYGFWLGDAFASGGSAGYDHKEMAITARGAWEAVKRHFRELGKDIQSEPFTVVGVGDMSGDVFGNGMLLSQQIRLQAAFDHRHIFLDPDPNPATSFAERQRMFELPRSSWDDYDRKKISKGGGVFARSLKSIPLSKEVKAMLGVEADSLAPSELMTAILKAPAELLYLGGIGTYVKAQRENQSDAGDKANDAVRVNGADLRVKVVGEGANLGLTQAGRIEFALRGGRVNTDAIDNSAGVDSSDHEVNIKILTGTLERTGVLDRKRRDKLLKSMTDDVAHHVLAHNYDQTLALSLMDLDAAGELEPHARYMSHLEGRGQLDRAVEGLPDAGVIAERRQAGKGLTRPEEAVLLAYGKLELKGDMATSPVADDPYFEDLLEGYFPKGVRKYDDALRRHRLRREIIATVVANDAINRCGPSFPTRLMAAASCDVTAFVTAYEAAKAVLGLPAIWDQVSALDGKIPAAGQMALYRRLAYTLRGETFWLARRAARSGLGVEALIKRYGPGAATLTTLLPDILSPVERGRLEAQVARLIEAGAPEPLARKVASLQPLTVAVDLVDLAEASSWSLPNAARLYDHVGRNFAFDRLRAAAAGFTAGDAFERTAVRRLVEDLLAEQGAVTRAVIAFAGDAKAGASEEAAQAAIAAWTTERRDIAQAARKAVEEIEAAGGAWSFAKLTIANAALRELANVEAK
ncbi:glutamate dehydrogenase [Phenylobacterium sp. Root77]|uniref:NAD-glutamate dehydrogenase n=1 Tax=unclassified Phenylobacterium TaxID=2640670 RepID=UPI0006FB0EB1|nr:MULTISPECIES: NAD-glutamate dehydrogenase [unclassified Phenylobacterium]KQW69202.1 glutamate dehydrogenase [Phenylobacterium sp. Root1277]KQW95431.1 glutamate dehydrogenase [Phenylobacterium sp. Root1290]KRC41221.1 glutamate dehydrogenase [Phenylobacterium sp. Root77]